MVRWRLQTVSLSPEEAGLCGCWQFIAVWRERQELRQGRVTEESEEYSFYCTSAAQGQHSTQQLLEIIRGHWSGSENGAHYRRDVSLGEDASQVRRGSAPQVLAALNNLVCSLVLREGVRNLAQFQRICVRRLDQWLDRQCC